MNSNDESDESDVIIKTINSANIIINKMAARIQALEEAARAMSVEFSYGTASSQLSAMNKLRDLVQINGVSNDQAASRVRRS